MISHKLLYKAAIALWMILILSGCYKPESQVRFRAVELNDSRTILAMLGFEAKFVYAKDSISSLTDKKIIEFLLLTEDINYSVDSLGRIFFKPHNKRNGYKSDMDFMWQKTNTWKQIKTGDERISIPDFSCKVDTTEKIKLEGVSFYEIRTVKDSVIFFRDDLGFVIDSNDSFHAYTDDDIRQFFKYVDYTSLEGKCLGKRVLLKFRFYQEVPEEMIVKIKVYALNKNVAVQVESMKKGYFN